MPIEALFCGLNVKAGRFSVKLSEASETQRGRDGGQQETARRVGDHGDAPRVVLAKSETAAAGGLTSI